MRLNKQAFGNVAFKKSLSYKNVAFSTHISINSYLEVAKLSTGLFVSAQCQYFVWMHCDVSCATSCWLAVLSLSIYLC